MSTTTSTFTVTSAAARGEDATEQSTKSSSTVSSSSISKEKSKKSSKKQRKDKKDKSKDKDKEKDKSKSKGEKSGVRTKFILEALRKDYYNLRDENKKLRRLISKRLPEQSKNIFDTYCSDPAKYKIPSHLKKSCPSGLDFSQMSISEGSKENTISSGEE